MLANSPQPLNEPRDPAYVQSTLAILRDAGAEINRIGPETSLAEALQLIAQTAVRLIDPDSVYGAAAVIYTYDATRNEFDPNSRVSAGEGQLPLSGDTPRPQGVGATALARRSRVLSYEESDIIFHPLKYQAGFRTAACYPLLVAGQPVGALYIDLRAQHRFSTDELFVLDTFVQLAAVAIYNTRQFEGINRALQRKVDELERLQQASRLISSRASLVDTLYEILNTAIELIRAEYGSFRLLDKHTGVLQPNMVAGGDEPDETNTESLEIGEHRGIMGWVAQHRTAVCIADLSQPPWADIYLPLHRDRAMRSELVVPLLGSGGGLEGVLNVESPRLNAFDASDQRLLEALATPAVIAIQEAKLLDTIQEITGQLILRSPDDLFALIIDRACDLLNVPHGAIWVIDHTQPQALIMRAANHALPPRYHIALHHSLIGTAILARQPVACLDLLSDQRVHYPDLAQHMGWISALVVPLVTRDDTPRGAFAVYSTESRVFSDWDTRLLTSLANHAALALQQAEALELLKLARERQAVAETFAVLGDIAANLLHRVNNLIGAIPVRIQGVLDKRPALQADGYVQPALRDVEDSARAAMEIARESMAYLRPLRLQPTSVEKCYQTAKDRLSLPAHVELSQSGLAALPPVLAGEEQLRLVLFNLLENALDAIADRPGHIKVNGRMIADPIDHTREWGEIAVIDDGPGVPAAYREKIFEPDFSTKASLQKLGFGLWWTKSLAQRFGGSIIVTDAAEPGCAFIVRLPPAPTLERTR